MAADYTNTIMTNSKYFDLITYSSYSVTPYTIISLIYYFLFVLLEIRISLMTSRST